MAEQDYIDHVLAALPKWFSDHPRAQETVKALAKVMQSAEDITAFWADQAEILLAVGAVGNEPDWLSQHAADRGSARQANETDASLRTRLRSVAEALTLSSVLTAAQAVVTAEGISGTVGVFELRPSRAFFLVNSADVAGPPGTITGTAPNMVFTPPAQFNPFNPKYDGVIGHTLNIIQAGNPANVGAFDVTGIVGDTITYQNASGVPDTAEYSIVRRVADGSNIFAKRHSYFNRGWRMGGNSPTLVVILPFGCTEATRTSVAESLRTKKGAGIRLVVECRANP